MIGKSGTGGGFKGLINYVTSKQDAEIIDQQNLFGDIKGWAAQMRNVAESRNLKKPVFHASLSLPKNERGTTEQWQKAGKAYLTKNGI